MAKAKTSEEKVEISFEDAIHGLERVVKDMESERMPLSQLVDRYEEGNRLLKVCQNRIEEAEQRIEIIAKGKSGPEVVPFEEGDASGDASAGPVAGKRSTTPAAKEVESSVEDEDEGEIQLF
ncbi:MAG: exodeoxyribonuclease VII small subunit [Verrucomicrobiota bacterium]